MNTILDVDAMHRHGPKGRWKAVALLSAGSAIFFWQFLHPIIRLECPVANELLGFALGLCLPWFTAAAIFRMGTWWSKAVALIAVIPLLLYTFVFLLGAVMVGASYENGRDLSFERFRETSWKGSEIRFYRTDAGATSDVGVVIRQERGLVPGVLLVRRLDDFYPCYSLDAASTDNGIEIRDGRSECSGFQDGRREYRLRPFVYF